MVIQLQNGSRIKDIDPIMPKFESALVTVIKMSFPSMQCFWSYTVNKQTMNDMLKILQTNKLEIF